MHGRVLIVDDDVSMLRLLERHLVQDGYEVLSARNGAEALRIVLSGGPQVCITDWTMPEMDGLELCRAIRSSEALRSMYIIILTAHAGRAHLVQAFEAGADDFLTKPVEREELRSRLKAGFRIFSMQQDLARQNCSLQEVNAELAALNYQLDQMARTDVLTGLANRREAMVRLEQCWASAERQDQPLACIALDLDHFKRINDEHGHDVGDCVLRETAQAFSRVVRASEILCRIGGEEFLVLCPNSTAASANTAAERFRQAVEAQEIRHSDLRLAVSVSAGVAERDEQTSTPDRLLKRADEALYTAKRLGRNCVCLAGQTHSTADKETTSRIALPVEGPAQVKDKENASTV